MGSQKARYLVTRYPSLNDIFNFSTKELCGIPGIDTSAHKITLKLGGRTIAVLRSGIDVIYPSENKKVADSIIENGTIISEFPFGTKPEGGNFPKRNLIISGLAHGVLVIEAGNKSGAILLH